MSMQLRLSNSWGEIARGVASAMWPPTLAKRVVVTGVSHFDELIVRGLVGLGSSIAWAGVKTVSNYVYEWQLKDLIALWQEPSIERKEKWLDPKTLPSMDLVSKAWNWMAWGGNPPAVPATQGLADPSTDCFFDAKIQSVVDELTRGMKANKEADRPFQNAIFYGPPGVGKSMVLEKVARGSCGNYLHFTASALRSALASGTHLWELQKIFAKIEASEHPTVLVIDECEQLFTDRKILRESNRLGSYDLLEAFLKRTGTSSKKFMLILATNHLDQVDEAILDRMDYKVCVGYPEEQERLAILKANIALKFGTSEDAIFTEEKLAEMAKKTAGFSGRAIEKMLTRLAVIRDISPDKKLTPEMINRAIEECAIEMIQALMALQPPAQQQPAARG